MIFDARALPLGARLDADLCVVGAGAGGLTAAAIAAEAGLRVVVLEAGPFLAPEDMTQREEQMLPLLLWDGAARTTADRLIRIHQGRGVGGSTLHNLNLCKRIPVTLLDAWRRSRRLERLDVARWGALYGEVEQLLGVTDVPASAWNQANRLLAQGAQALGWRGGGLAHNRSGCVGSGFCELGCAYDAKNHAAKVLLPRLIAARGEVLVHCQAVRIDHDDRQVRGVVAAVLDGAGEATAELMVRSPRVCLAASATATPALLLRSGVPDPSGATGRGLRIHPAVIAAGVFDEPVLAWRGIPQSYECTEFLDLDAEHAADAAGGDPDLAVFGHEPPGRPAAAGKPRRLWIVPAFGHPLGAATLLPGHGAGHRRWMERYRHLAVLTAMLHDRSAGTVRPAGPLRLRVDYELGPADRRELAQGAIACARLLFAAGAREVLLPWAPPVVLADVAALDRLPPNWTPDTATMRPSAVHPMASVPMAGDPRLGAVGDDGRHHALSGLWIADGSLLPGSIGGPPQVSVYALGLHVGRAIAASR